MKHLFTCFLFVLFLHTAFGQLGSFPTPDPGFRQAAQTVSTISRGLRDAKQAQELKQQQEQLEEEYAAFIIQGDTLFNQGNYEAAIASYNDALRRKEQQYPRDQIAKANVQLARRQQDEYQLLVDVADSLYGQMNYREAIVRYNEALAKKPMQYAKDQVAKANAELARWQKVQFSGLLISDTRIDDFSSKAYSDDPYSDFMKPGKYEWLNQSLVYSNFQTLDGIAVPANTRLVIYSERNFQGKVLLDVTGPAVVNNSTLKKSGQVSQVDSKSFGSGLQATFPPSVRTWSETDMNTWVNGSMEIIAIPQ